MGFHSNRCLVHECTSKYLDPDFLAKFDDMLLMGLCEDKETMLRGDLNADYLTKTKNIEVKRIIRENGCEQIRNKPTVLVLPRIQNANRYNSQIPRTKCIKIHCLWRLSKRSRSCWCDYKEKQ